MLDLRVVAELRELRDGDVARGSAPGVVTRTVRGVITNRFQPRVSVRTYAVLLGDLPLEEVDLRTLRRDRGKTVRSYDFIVP